MKHFLVMINYTVPLEKIDAILSQHRMFLQEGYDNKTLLFSGPKNPRIGGIVAARAASIDVIKAFFNHDPYFINNFATYDFIEFNPVKHQNFLDPWIEGE
ncbi:MAG: YciI family protein [Ignavibacteriaceae bacterium]